VAADLGLVAHAAERDADVLAAERARDRATERGLANAGRADEQQDRAVLVRRELAHREELEDAALHLLEAGVLGLEDGAGRGHVEAILGEHVPRDLEEVLDVRARDVVLGRRRCHLAHTRQLLLRNRADLVAHLAVFDLLAEVVDLGVVVLLAELLLDLPHAIAQHALAVRAARLALELRADIGLEAEHGGLALERRDDPLEALHRVGLDQQGGQVIALELEVRRGRIDELVGIDDRLDLGARELALGLLLLALLVAGLLRLRVGDHGHEVIADLRGGRRERIRSGRRGGRELRDARDQERLGGDQRIDVHALEEPHHRGEPAGRVLDDLHDLGAHADLVKILLTRVANRGVLLRDDDDQVVVARCSFDRANRGFTADLQRADMTRQLDLRAQRNDGVLTGSLGVFRHRFPYCTTFQSFCSRLRRRVTSWISCFFWSSSRFPGTSIWTVM
jgi:hypothetical protein